MKTYTIRHVPKQESLAVQSERLDTVLQAAAEKYPCNGPAGWTHERRRGENVYDRWTQLEATPLILNPTGLIVECFDTRPVTEDFQLPFKPGDKVKWKDPHHVKSNDGLVEGVYVRRDRGPDMKLHVTKDRDGQYWWVGIDSIERIEEAPPVGE